MIKKERKVGGIVNPKILNSIFLDIGKQNVDIFIKNLANHLNVKGKAFIVGLGHIELQETKRKQRYDYRSGKLVKTNPYRISVKATGKFKKDLLKAMGKSY